jgi:hypothetical protein
MCIHESVECSCLNLSIMPFSVLFSFAQALMKDGEGGDFLAIAWQYPGQEFEVIPAYYSRVTRPGWPVTCTHDSECEDGVWCNGKLSNRSTSFGYARTMDTIL